MLERIITRISNVYDFLLQYWYFFKAETICQPNFLILSCVTLGNFLSSLSEARLHLVCSCNFDLYSIHTVKWCVIPWVPHFVFYFNSINFALIVF